MNSLCDNIVDLDELTNCYDDVLLRVLNNHAPVRRKLLKVKLYRIVNSLCNAPQEDPLPPHNDLGQLANKFNDYFFRKIK